MQIDRRKWPLRLGLAARLLAPLPVLLALGPAAAQADVTLLRGSGARALFESREGCITTVVTVLASTEAIRTIPNGDVQRIQLAVISVEQFDDVANSTPDLLCGTSPDPVIQDSSATIENPDFTFKPHLGFARLKGSAQLFDVHAGVFRDVTFDIRWTGVGRRSVTATHEKLDLGDQVAISNTVEEQRRARATGAVIEGLVNYTPEIAQNDDTRLFRVLSGEILLERK
jgi:hypothetical protein